MYEAKPNLQTQQAWMLFNGKITTTTLKTKFDTQNGYVPYQEYSCNRIEQKKSQIDY